MNKAQEVQSRTLVVLVGLTRSIRATYKAIISNVLEPNAPSDLSVALDTNETLPSAVSAAFRPYLVAFSNSRPPCVNQKVCHYFGGCPQIVFGLGWTALNNQRTNLHRYYTYAAVVRTDAMVVFPFSFRATFESAPSPGFRSAFKSLQHRNGMANQSRDVSRTHFLCAGNAEMLPLFLQQKQKTEWCPKDYAACEKSARFSAVTVRSPRAIFVMGSDWLQFGLAHNVIKYYDSMYYHWGKTYRSVFGPALTNESRWCSISEANLYLSIWASGLELVDYFGQHDWDIPLPLQEIQRLRQHPVWLVRRWHLPKNSNEAGKPDSRGSFLLRRDATRLVSNMSNKNHG